MSLTDVINPQVGIGLMLSANSWVSLTSESLSKKGYIITAAKNCLNSQQ